MKNRLGIVLSLCLAGCDRDAAPKGEGSITAGDAMFSEIAKIPSGTVPPGYTRFDFIQGIHTPTSLPDKVNLLERLLQITNRTSTI